MTTKPRKINLEQRDAKSKHLLEYAYACGWLTEGVVGVFTDLIDVKGRLPEIAENSLLSRTVLFVVDGKIYAGHYHINGWFYGCEETHGNKMARGRPDATVGKYDGPNDKPDATAWCYLREE